MDEQKVIDQIKAHMAAQRISQTELGRRIAPDSNSPRQLAHQYLAGRRSLFSESGRAILDALGLEVVIQPKSQK